MKLFMYLLPAVLTMSCTGGKKFAGAANSAAADKPVETEGDSIPEGDAEPEPSPAPIPVSEPTIPVTKIGINFEDLLVPKDPEKARGYKADFNDAVLCFEGGFDFAKSSTTITSSKDQSVHVKTFSGSGCTHEITVNVVQADGSIRKTQKFSSKSKDDKIDLDFKKGDKLEVYMQPTLASPGATDSCDSSLKRDMHTAAYAQVGANVCNDSGD